MAYQSLYRRYRPQKFAEIKGQDHVVRALQSAVREEKVGHAYLLHGPRGSGKTSTARVLAKALNCTDLGADGEPCCVCESCESIQKGRSFDLQELDAASNNKVDDMRGLLERVNLASPGRAKVYLLDEVHMLTAGAENALLKTLEEPPPHVTWVLATTEPHKVVETIRSRCQVFELGLIDAVILAEHVRHVVDDAQLGLDDEAIDQAVSEGGGSVRDTLTALERIVAGGGTAERDPSTDAILAAVAGHDRAAALSAVGDAVRRGRDPRTIGETALAGLRDAFLTSMGDPPARMSEHERTRAADLAQQMAPAAITRALETLGRALIDMRQAPDPRIDIEVALMRLCQPDEDRSLDALAHRVRQIEDRLEASLAGAPPVAPRPVPPSSGPAPAPPSRAGTAAVPAAPARATSPTPPAATASAAAPASSEPSTSRGAPAGAPVVAAGSTSQGAGAAVASPEEPSGSLPTAAAARDVSRAAGDRPADAARRVLSQRRSAAVARGETPAAGPSGAPSAAPSAHGSASPPGPAPSVPGAVPPPGPAPSAVGVAPPTASGVVPPPPLVPAPDLDSLHPNTPTEVVQWAAQHLGLDRAFVVARAKELEPDQERRRDPARLHDLWKDLVAHAAQSAGESPAPSASDVVPAATSPLAEENSLDHAPSSAGEPAAQEAPPVADDHAPDVTAAYDDADGFDLADLESLVEAPSHAQDIEQKIKAAFPGTEFVLLPDPTEPQDGQNE